MGLAAGIFRWHFGSKSFPRFRGFGSGRRVIHFSCQAVKDTFEAARKVLLGIHHEVYTDALGGPLRVRKQTADSRAWVRVEFACIASGTEGCKCKGRLSICKLGYVVASSLWAVGLAAEHLICCTAATRGDVFVELNGVAHSHSGRRTTRKLPLGLRQVLESIMVRNPTLPLKRLRSKAEEDLNETFDPPTARLIKHWKETWTGKYKAANKKKAAVEVPTAQSVAVSEQDAPSEEPDVRPAVPATPSGD
eukprot:scaffold301_cov243-Pinguiococcus_pyrenoidosus.AAC.125